MLEKTGKIREPKAKSSHKSVQKQDISKTDRRNFYKPGRRNFMSFYTKNRRGLFFHRPRRFFAPYLFFTVLRTA